MKKIYFSTFSAALFVLFFAFQTNAQITFQAGVGAGYSVPMGDYGGTTIDFYNGTKYGMKSGTNFHGKARVGFLFINAFGEIGYSTFSGSGESEPGKGSIDISNKIFSIKLGPEYAISIPLSPITPYFQGFVALNTFSGSVDFKAIPGDGVPTGTYDIASATRIGIGGGAGVMFSLGGIKLDVNVQYHLLNVAPKEFKTGDLAVKKRSDSYLNLNDDKDPRYIAGDNDYFISDSRGISALEFKLSVMFGL